MLKYFAALLAGALGAGVALGQVAIPMGAGSYASIPPASAGTAAQGVATQSLYVVSGNGRPVPSNKWWTDLVVQQYAGNLWAHPLVVSADAQGINICKPDFNTVYDNAHSFLGTNFQPDFPLRLQGQGFAPADARALNWGDWTVTFRMQQSVSQYMDVTLGHGLPYVWARFSGVAPRLVSGTSASYFQDDGSAPTFPVTANHLGIQYGGRSYGIFAPDNTTFALNNDTLSVTFAGPDSYLVVSAMPSAGDLAYFAQFAYAVPTNSVMNWAYDPAAATVTTSWHLATQPWKGTQTNTIQGWIPHHWRNANNFSYNGLEYWTARGRMKCTTGTDFQIVYNFGGLVPTLPAPMPLRLANDYNPTRMASYITSVAAGTGVAADTYAGGKDLVKYGQHLVLAGLMGRPELTNLENTVRTTLADWYSYNPSGDGRYFAFYPAWKGLVGFPASYGSDHFNDHHFHYGYLTHAAALLGMYDQNFLANYGPMIKMVAKEYANWDRSETNFPFLRTFDIWAGHSHADGYSSATKGNNQESSSESMQAWGALFLMGAMLADDQMRAAGAMGYAVESEAVRQYYFNTPKFYDASDSNWPVNYTKTVVGILWDSGQECQTYFGADALYVHGIQWLPSTPLLAYQALDPAFTQYDYNNMLSERGNPSVSAMGAQWGNYALSYAAQFDPDYSAAQFDQLYAAGNAVATDINYAGVTYYQTHAMRMLGPRQWQFHLSLPTSAVYYNPATVQYSYVAYNPSGTAQAASVYSNNVVIGTLVVPAYTLVNAHYLAGALAVVATSPAPTQTNVATSMGQITVTFSQNVSAASLAGATLTGAGVSGMTYAQGGGTRVITFSINGTLQPSQTYTVTIPAATTVAGGSTTLGSPYTFAFTTAPLLAVTATSPSANQADVSPNLSQISVTFNQSVSAASLATASLTGPNVTGLSYYQGDGSPTIVFNINGSLQPLQTYTVTIPSTATVAGGTNHLASSYTFTFTTAAVPPPTPNPVANPGFEIAGANASLATNWTVTQAVGGPVYAVRTNDNPHSGSFDFQVHLASTGGGPVVEFAQSSISVTGGVTYPFTFYANALSGSQGYNAQWRVLWNAGGDTGFQSFVPGNNTYTLISNSLTAPLTATAATIYFHFAGAASPSQSANINIDDVSLLSTNSGGGGTVVNRTNVVVPSVLPGVGISWPTLAGSNYVVQWTPDLGLNPAWSNLAPVIVGDGTTNTFFDPLDANSRKFYRVQQAP